MKLIIDIPEKDLEFIKDLGFIGGFRGSTKTIQSNVINAIRNGKPYEETQGDLINRDALKKALHNFFDGKVIDEPAYILRDVFCYIDSAPAVEINTNDIEYKAYCKGLEDGKKIARPQGEWKHIIEEDNDVECPFCGFQEDGIYYNFCPSCGARLKVKGGVE